MVAAESQKVEGPSAGARTIHVDDHPLYCLGLRTALSAAVDIELVGEAHSAAAALELARQVHFDVALIDVVLPSSDGIALTASIRELQPSCKVLGLSMIDEPVRIAQMFRAGASGYALKSQPPAELLAAIRMVISGIEYLPTSISSEQVDRHRRSEENSPTRLSVREREVFVCLIRGQTNSAIATALFISRRTVEAHRLHIQRKLNAHSIVELVAIATRYGIL